MTDLIHKRNTFTVSKSSNISPSQDKEDIIIGSKERSFFPSTIRTSLLSADGKISSLLVLAG